MEGTAFRLKATNVPFWELCLTDVNLLDLEEGHGKKARQASHSQTLITGFCSARLSTGYTTTEASTQSDLALCVADARRLGSDIRRALLFALSVQSA
jgi:hypothetical protein